MTSCETCEARISALIDGELDSIEVIEMMDHAMECVSCREFYADARALDRRLRAGVTGTAAEPAVVIPILPPGVWERIERAGRAPEPQPLRQWGLRIAALVLVGIGLWNIGGLRREPVATPAQAYDISLEENAAGMTETRFVEMTAELMKSDRRFHRAMYQVMKDINEATGAREGSEDAFVVQPEDRDRETRERESRLPS